MRKWLIFILLLGSTLFPSAASAQGSVKLKSIHVELWSEYDQPTMLVIHEFIVDESTPLPVDVTVRFPKDANLTAAAYQENGALISMDFSGPTEQGDWQTVTLKVDSRNPYRVEYYEPLTRNGNQRSFTFRWIGDYPVNDFSVTAQIPADSTNVVTDPPFASTTKSDDGKSLIGSLTKGSLGMGQATEFKIDYERNAETVSNPSNSSNVQPSEPVGANTEGRVIVDNLPWIIGGLGLALIGVALFFYWRSTQTSEQKSRRRRRAHRNDEQAEAGEAYCHECGTRARPNDRFCRTCGSKLRT